MRRGQIVFCCIIFAIFAGPGLSEPIPQTWDHQPNLLAMNEEQVAQLSPLLQQVRRVMVDKGVAIRALEVELATATNAQHIHQLERKMSGLALVAEIEILEIQARHLRTEGRIAAAEIIEANALELKKPAPRAVAQSVPQRQAVQK